MQVSKILVQLRGDDSDTDAVNLACILGRKYHAKIYAVYVIIVRLTLPMDTELKSETEKAENVLEHMRAMVESQSCQMEKIIIKTREAGQAIIEAVNEYAVDLIVIVINNMRRFGQFSLGSTVPYILKNAPCQVILYQQHTP